MLYIINASETSCEAFALLSFQVGRLEAALEDVVQDRRGEVHDRRQEDAAVDQNVRPAEGGEHCAKHDPYLAPSPFRKVFIYLRHACHVRPTTISRAQYVS